MGGSAMAELTTAAPRRLLGLPARKAFTEEELQQGWRTAAKAAHPDAGGSDAAMARLNAARDLLQPLAQMLGHSYLQQIADSVEAIAAAAERIAQELEQQQQGGQH